MKKTISIILSMLMIIGCIIATPASAAEYNATIKFGTATYEYVKGTEITYTCDLTTDSIIENGQFYLHYPENILNITDVQFPVAKDAIYNHSENLENMMKFTFSKASANPKDLYDFTNGGNLVTVTFEVINNGNGEVSLEKVVLSNHGNDSTKDALATAKFTEKLSGGNYSDPKISATRKNLFVKKTTTLKVIDGSEATPVWSSSNSKIASVDENGTVTAKKAGTAVITAEKDGIKMTCKVTVKNPTVKAKKATIKVKKSTKIVVKNAVGKTTFKSKTPKVATVTTSGKVTALKKGTAKIKVKASGVNFVIKITVK